MPATLVRMSPTQSQRLQEALLMIYRNVGEFTGLLVRVEQVYTHLETTGFTYRENVLSIINQAAGGGWLMALLDVVLKQVSDPEIEAIRDELLPSTPGAGISPFDVCRLTGANVMVNREGLREHLRSMSKPTGKRFLIVKGPRRSGRTHTVQLLSYVQQQRGGFQIISIDLERFARTAGPQIVGATFASPINITTLAPHGLTSGSSVYITEVLGNHAANGLWRVTVASPRDFLLDGSNGSGVYLKGGIACLQTPVEAWHLAEKLLNLLQFDVRMPDPPTDAQWARWVQTFCDRFEAHAREHERQWQLQYGHARQEQVWIVIDAFHAVLLAQSSVDLIRELANRINVTLAHFRLVLLGFEDSLPSQVLNHLEEESIEVISEEKVVDFILLTLKQMQVALADDEVIDLVEAILKEAHPDDPDFLSKLGPVASREFERLVAQSV